MLTLRNIPTGVYRYEADNNSEYRRKKNVDREILP